MFDATATEVPHISIPTTAVPDAVILPDIEAPDSLVQAQPARAGLSLLKRGFDMVVALAALLFILPLLAAVALAIWIESGRPIFFKQHRTGYRGRKFVILKMRTMTVLEDGDELRQATRGDVRVTRVGAFLRKSSIDELPQLINVLKGDMSLVGPRPHALAHDHLYGSLMPEYRLRFRARPGLTGLAQVSGLRGEVHDVDGMARRVEADLTYIDRWSPALDVKIMLQTIPLMFHDTKAY
jgi:putative colanic acid biosysnthesis UDP-glucose lipid carrier transferase